MKPLSPSEIHKEAIESVPDCIISGFNKAILDNWNGSSAHFTISEVHNNIRAINDGVVPEYYWDIVKAKFKEAGWSKIDYDRPGYCETYETNYTFSK